MEKRENLENFLKVQYIKYLEYHESEDSELDLYLDLANWGTPGRLERESLKA